MMVGFSSAVNRFRPNLHNFSTGLSLPSIPFGGRFLHNCQNLTTVQAHDGSR